MVAAVRPFILDHCKPLTCMGLHLHAQSLHLLPRHHLRARSEWGAWCTTVGTKGCANSLHTSLARTHRIGCGRHVEDNHLIFLELGGVEHMNVVHIGFLAEIAINRPRVECVASY